MWSDATGHQGFDRDTEARPRAAVSATAVSADGSWLVVARTNGHLALYYPSAPLLWPTRLLVRSETTGEPFNFVHVHHCECRGVLTTQSLHAVPTKVVQLPARAPDHRLLGRLHLALRARRAQKPRTIHPHRRGPGARAASLVSWPHLVVKHSAAASTCPSD